MLLELDEMTKYLKGTVGGVFDIGTQWDQETYDELGINDVLAFKTGSLGHRDNDEQTFLDKYVIENELDSRYNFINIDAQGNPHTVLEVFKGAMNTLNDIDYIYTTVNTVDVCDNCVNMDELDELLGTLYGFKRVLTYLNENDTQGNALYVKEE